jgi:hypothetical protein
MANSPVMRNILHASWVIWSTVNFAGLFFNADLRFYAAGMDGARRENLLGEFNAEIFPSNIPRDSGRAPI